jgi:hypothetical protein
MHPTPILDLPFGAGSFHIRSRRTIRLGPLSVDIRSNERDFQGLRFFAGNDDFESPPYPDFTLSLCNLKVDGPWPMPSIAAATDRSYRGKRMAAGYYLTDHFGPPAFLITRGREYWIFAEDFDPILWPYAVKHLCSVYAIESGLLHLKAAGVAVGGRGVLLVGRGNSGKTVILASLCGAGAQFLSNTHAFVQGQTLIGVPTAMRVRRDDIFGSIITQRGLAPSVKAGEYTLDPVSDMGWSRAPSVPIAALCLLDYRGPEHCLVKELDRQTMYEYMEQFALAVNVYGLKEDLLDHLNGDVERFSRMASGMKAGLRALVESARCYYVSCDATDPQNLSAVWDCLTG